MKINTDKDCNIIIYDDTEYPINGLNYLNSVSLYIVVLNKCDGQEILYNKLVPHDYKSQNPIVLGKQSQGYITVHHYILPKDPSEQPETPDDCRYVRTENYITNEDIDNIISLTPISSSTDSNTIIDYTIDNIHYYYSDGEKIYFKSIDGSIREVSEQELVEVNADAYNLIKHTYDFFSVCNLRKCYVALCQKIFNSRAFDRCFNNKVDSDLIYRRDLVWAALNVIQYLVDSNQLCEAQRLLERITGCNGLCSNTELGIQGCCCSQ